MAKIIGVRFRQAGKIYYFDPGDLDIKTGEHVIVETARGIEYGKVSLEPREVSQQALTAPLKRVIRKASSEDEEKNLKNRAKEKDAYQICQERIRKYGLEMKLIDVEYTFDNNKILFYFTADGRIDFRELVKDLASVFKTRIELRQIGVRDETKMLGGIGICGRPLCCHSYMSDFVPVSIKMAKEQTLSLNPAKISGVCGRLMCCLKYEQETYEWLHEKLPAAGTRVLTEDGFEGFVSNVNVMRQKVKVVINLDNDAKEAREYDPSQLTFKGPGNDSRRKKEQDQPQEQDAVSGPSPEKADKKSTDRPDSGKQDASRREKRGNRGKNREGQAARSEKSRGSFRGGRRRRNDQKEHKDAPRE